MTDGKMLAWAARWHYPYLRLGDKDAIPHGQPSWEKFVTNADRRRKATAQHQIARWNALASEVAE